MHEDFVSQGNRQVNEVRQINRDLVEKALRMRCLGYIAQVKAQLLTETIFEVDKSKKTLSRFNAQVLQQREIIAAQNAHLEQANEALQKGREELEKRVAERTADLLRVNKALKAEVDERKRTAAALRDNENKFRGLLESAPDAMVIANARGEIVLVNKQTEQLFGYTRDELIGQAVEMLLPADVHERHVLHRKAYFKQPRPRPMGCGIELHGLRKDGGSIPVEVSLSPIRTSEGELVSSAIRDVSQRNQAEQALRESEAQFRALFQNAGIGIALVDMQGHPRRSNPALQAMLGYSAEELGSMVFTEFTHPDDADKDMGLYRELMAGKRNAYKMEKRYYRKDGELIHANLTVTLIRDAGGLPYMGIGMVEDITERVEAEAANRRSTRVYEFLARYNEVTSGLNVDAVVEATLDFLHERLGIEEGSVALISDDRSRFIVKLGTQPRGAKFERGVSFPLDATVLSKVIERREPLYRPDIATRVHLYGIDKKMLEAGLRSDFLTPLWVEDTCIGTLNAAKSRVDGFSELDRQVISLLAPRLAQALQNAKLFDALRASGENLAEAQRIAQLGSWELDLTRNRLSWSKQTYRIFGIDPNSFGCSYEAFINTVHPDDRAFVNQAYTDSLDNHRSYNIVHRLLMSDGRIKYVNERCETFYDDQGKPLRSIGTVQDITERHQGEQARARLAAILEATTDFVATADASGNVLYLNRAARQVSGIGEAEPSALNLTDFHPPALRAMVAEQGIPGAIREGAWSGETALLDAQGNEIAASQVILAHKDDKGALAYLSTIIRDISERKRAEQALRISEQRHRLLFETMAQGVVYQDRNGQVISANPAAERLLNLTQAQILGQGSHNTRWKIIHENGQEYLPEEHPPMVTLRTGKPVENAVMGIFNTAEERYVWILVNSIAQFRPGETRPYQVYSTFTDITERKRAEEELKESESRFRRLADRAPALIWMSDTSKQCTYFNKSWLDYTGRELEQELGDGWTEGVHPQDLEHCVSVYGTAFDTQEEFEMEYRLRRADGSYGWIFDAGIPRFTDDGGFEGYIGYCWDINNRREAEAALRAAHDELEQRVQERTHALEEANAGLMIQIEVRERAEEALRKSEERYRSVYDTAPLGFVVWDRNHAILDWNEQAARMFGWSKEEVLGKSVFALLLSDMRGVSPAPGDTEPLSRMARHAIHESLTKAGRRIVCDWSHSHLRDSAGEVIGVLSLALDITERQKAEAALRESEKRFRSLVEQATDGIYLMDDQSRFVDVNQQACLSTGYSREELLQGSAKDIDPGFIPGQHIEQYWRPLQPGRPIVFETMLKRKDGSTFPVEVRLGRIELGGRTLYLAIDRDITGRKRIEKMKDEFISVVSHELRTPLTAIHGALGLLAGGAVGDFSEAGETLIDVALRNSERLGVLVTDLLDTEMIVSGKMVFHLETRDIMPLLELAVTENRPYAGAHRVRLELGAALSDAWVRVDEDRFMQIMANLLSNAIKFSPKNAVVGISVERQGAMIRVNIRDQGPGIPESFRERIFEKFQQVDSSDRRKKGGTGLGLSITKMLVEGMGGRIDYESSAKTGTRFYFDLPEQHH